MEPILPGLWVEDVEETGIRIREQISIDETDRWIVFGYQGKKCVSVQGWKIKKNAEDWAQRLRRMKLRVRTLPKSKVKMETEPEMKRDALKKAFLNAKVVV